ncbi:hypothetical protein FOMPIDRAFT_1050652 [Fomitopsis schrenkii]|uniref:Uncharacterized protein n=1 Tax=Fomitopsis schrenkii TaxID=2126942 RepID=S8E7P4_FOMSC|nr:hypothetical protein FOMPIDRAFT_1050652 [Fomitopsis schrenkii]
MNSSTHRNLRKESVLHLHLTYNPEEPHEARRFRLIAFGRYSWDTLLTLGFDQAAVSNMQADRNLLEEQHSLSGAALMILDARAARIISIVRYIVPTDMVPNQLDEWRMVLGRMVRGDA